MVDSSFEGATCGRATSGDALDAVDIPTGSLNETTPHDGPHIGATS